jgi:hypothetical protein
MNGYIKLHRGLLEHWISQDPEKLKRWLIMLMEVNFKESKFNIGNSIYKVPVGGSVKSIRTWSKLFNCGTKSTLNFFKLLEDDKMIKRKTLGKGKHSTTLVIISNYKQYQVQKETLTTTQAQHKGHTEEESKEGKNVYRAFKHLSISVNEFTKLESQYSKQQIDSILDKIQNYAQNKRYTSLYLTALDWLKREHKQHTPSGQDNYAKNAMDQLRQQGYDI